MSLRATLIGTLTIILSLVMAYSVVPSSEYYYTVCARFTDSIDLDDARDKLEAYGCYVVAMGTHPSFGNYIEVDCSGDRYWVFSNFMLLAKWYYLSNPEDVLYVDTNYNLHVVPLELINEYRPKMSDICGVIGAECVVALISDVPYMYYGTLTFGISTDRYLEGRTSLGYILNFSKVYFSLYAYSSNPDYGTCTATATVMNDSLIEYRTYASPNSKKYDSYTSKQYPYISDLRRIILAYDYKTQPPLGVTVTIKVGTSWYTFPQHTFYGFRTPIYVSGEATEPKMVNFFFDIREIPHKVVCGDMICDNPYEDYSTCPLDCPPWCGDGICTSEYNGMLWENVTSCPEDCLVVVKREGEVVEKTETLKKAILTLTATALALLSITIVLRNKLKEEIKLRRRGR